MTTEASTGSISLRISDCFQMVKGKTILVRGLEDP
jgi:hypothetical protein